MLKFAIIGVGGLGKVHLGNVIELEKKRGDIKLVALCDVDESRFTEKIVTNLGGDAPSVDLSRFKLYTDANELFDKEELDFVITALPTYIHEKIAVLALEKGLHVFSEKPMARTLEQCQNMIDKAKENKKLLMIGQCLRYWPEYVKLKEYIDSKEFGKVIRAEFRRYSATPIWSWQNWYLDFEKSGCAALDMHVHDVDFINYAFGKPNSVLSVASHEKSKFDSIFTTYNYDDMFVMSACDWGLPSSYPFSPSFLVRFENAVVEMNSNGMKVYPEGKQAFDPKLLHQSPYMNEIDDFINCINEKRELSVVQPNSVKLTMKIALAEMESAERGVVVNV